MANVCVADVPIERMPTAWRHHFTGYLAINIPYVHRRSSGGWHWTARFEPS